MLRRFVNAAPKSIFVSFKALSFVVHDVEEQ